MTQIPYNILYPFLFSAFISQKIKDIKEPKQHLY